MKVSCKEVEIPILAKSTVVYTAHIDFKDYDKIFAFAKWKCPISYRPHGGMYDIDGIEAAFSDGTSEWLSFCRIRDLIEKNWDYVKQVLNEDGEDLSEYTETIGDRDTLTLKCSKIIFRVSDTKGIAFDRIWGRSMYECVL